MTKIMQNFSHICLRNLCGVLTYVGCIGKIFFKKIVKKLEVRARSPPHAPKSAVWVNLAPIYREVFIFYWESGTHIKSVKQINF